MILQGVTARTATNSPTVVVESGSLVVRDSTIQESTGYAQAAIVITGGTVDLGTTASPGGNTFNVNGAGQLLEDTTPGPVPDIGNTLEVNGSPLPSRFLSFTSLGSSIASSVYGQPVTLTASVQAADPTDGTPTGVVEFTDTTTGAVLGTVPISNGVAALTSSTLTVGSDAITAEYDGGGNFAFSFAALAQNVQQDATTTVLGSSAGSPKYGQTLTFTATVSTQAPVSARPRARSSFTTGRSARRTRSAPARCARARRE